MGQAQADCVLWVGTVSDYSLDSSQYDTRTKNSGKLHFRCGKKIL